MNHAVIRRADRTALALVAGLCAVFVAMAGAVSTASAEIDGPCGATVNGIDVETLDSGDKGDAIKVKKGGQVELTMSSTVGFQSHEIELDYFGQKLPGDKRDDNGDSFFSDFVDVDDYATAGVGLYKVYGVATLTNGDVCSGAVLIDVEGNPLTTIAGAAGAGAVALGTVGAAAGLASSAASSSGGIGGIKDMVEEAFRESRATEKPAAGGLDDMKDMVEDAFRESRAKDEAAAEAARLDRVLDDLAGNGNPYNPLGALFGCLGALVFAVITLPLRLPFMAISSGGDSAPAPASKPRRFPRARWTPRITILGIICGLIAGAGAAVLLQQYSIAIATRALLIQMLIAGVVVYGLVMPTIGRTIAVMRVNGRVSQLEKRLGR
ncbi:MAG: hypothetical protein HY874_10555 [Chloroflexi bacterium]|nr:hypothetical protein [Chloroflexota bacterium]